VALVTTLAGQAGVQGSTDGTGSAARFDQPDGVACDARGNIYVADTENDTIRKITPAGVVTTLAGRAGDLAGPDAPSGALPNSPVGVACDPLGDLYVADGPAILKISPAGVVTTLAGNESVSGSADGTGSAARFDVPVGVACDALGNVYVSDIIDDTIRKITPDGVVTTLAGQAGVQGSTDGTGSAARFGQPDGVACDARGNIYVADTFNHDIRKITPTGVVTTLAGKADALYGNVDGSGSAARFTTPIGIVCAPDGNLYVMQGNNLLREVTPAGVVTTLAGHGQGSADGIGRAASFRAGQQIACDKQGDLYVADCGNDTIRKITWGN
jgi:hypothetical protein